MEALIQSRLGGIVRIHKAADEPLAEVTGVNALLWLWAAPTGFQPFAGNRNGRLLGPFEISGTETHRTDSPTTVALRVHGTPLSNDPSSVPSLNCNPAGLGLVSLCETGEWFAGGINRHKRNTVIMKPNLWQGVWTGSCLLAAVISSTAGPLQRSDVIRDPVWVLHLDCDALRPTAIGAYLLGEMAKPEAEKKIAAFQAIFSFDPRTALHGVTLYGASPAQEDGVLLFYADFDAARLTTLAEGAKEHESTTHGKHVIHSWLDEKKRAKDGVKPRVYAAIHGGQIVIFGQKENRVALALDVLDRTKPNLASSTQFGSLGDGGENAFALGAARKVALPASDPSAAVLKQSKMATLSIGESRGQVQGELKLVADSEEVAKQMESIGRGVVGLMALQKDKPDSVKLAQALSVQQEGAGLTVRLSLPAGDLVAMMEASAARKAAKDAARHAEP